MQCLYIYVIDRDFGFAPNPFHGFCSLATCKPNIRSVAKIGDWIIGVGGRNLKATGKCIFAMKVSNAISFDEYWENPLYKHKKPIRNGSKATIVGDNIYHQQDGEWQQLNSHHTNPDGSPNAHNIKTDTKTNRVLLSNSFFYFGSNAVVIPNEILVNLGYKNGIGHRKFPFENEETHPLISFLKNHHSSNVLYGDPFAFDKASSRYSAGNNKVTVD